MHYLLTVTTACALSVVALSPVAAQKTPRDSAFALFDKGKRKDALPILERLVAAGSKDRGVYERYGKALFTGSYALPDAASRKIQRAKARATFVKAVSMGSNDPEVRARAEDIPEDGGNEPKYSKNEDVNAEIRKGEAAYGSEDYPTALTHLRAALVIEPQSYFAHLVMGDTYYVMEKYDSAAMWVEKATVIDPTIETAWRIWSEALRKMKKLDDARDKALEAVIANPYSRLSIIGLLNWTNEMQIPTGYLSVDMKRMPKKSLQAYDSVRKVWKGEGFEVSAKFKQAFPDEIAYRHSFPEELEAIKAALATNSDDPGMNYLRKIDGVGLLEPYVLIARANSEIVKDYPAFKKQRESLIRRFWTNLVIGAKYIV